MKMEAIRRLGGTALSVSLIASYVFIGLEQAVAEEVTPSGSEVIVIVDGPNLIGLPADPALPSPPREDPPGATVPSEPAPSPGDTPIYNPGLEPRVPPIEAPREGQSPSPDFPVQVNPPAEPATNVGTPQQQSVAAPKPEAVETAEVSSKPTNDIQVVVAKPVLISTSMISISAPLSAGSTMITPAAKASLAKTAALVKTSSKSVSISVKTTGTSVSKATAQANAIVAELKKRGVSAVTVIKRVGNKTSVSVLVTKKKP
jgi:hypothetical protein